MLRDTTTPDDIIRLKEQQLELHSDYEDLKKVLLTLLLSCMWDNSNFLSCRHLLYGTKYLETFLPQVTSNNSL